jgi:hypothetical protein
MRKIFRFSFQRESYWLVAIYLVVPLLAILLFIVVPGLWRRWSPSSSARGEPALSLAITV